MRHSAIYSSPWDEVAVNVRAPVADAPMAAESAVCSLSTGRYSQARLPSSTMEASASTSVVWGVMG